MDISPSDKVPSRRFRRLRWFLLAIILIVGLSWLTTWLWQRSLQGRKRAMQSWMDDTLNADVSILGGMTVRLNLVRPSRLVLHNVEIEHPNPTFPGKFVTAQRMRAYAGPFSVYNLIAGPLELEFDDMHVAVEENESGEWSVEGIMAPLAAGNSPFPFPLPKIASWNAAINEGSLTLRRRGYEMRLALDLMVGGRRKSDTITVQGRKASVNISEPDGTREYTGRIASSRAALRPGGKPGRFEPIPGACEIRFDALPLAVAPFLFQGFPIYAMAGHFQGVLDFREHANADGELVAEGRLIDAPLSFFGLPPAAPFSLHWPVLPRDAGQEARLHIGPSGYGAFDMVMPLDEDGRPRSLSMQGEVAVLDDIPAFFSENPIWPDWLTRTFLTIEWRAREWRVFGWRGENMRLNLLRSASGMFLTGEGEMMTGRVRIALSPDQPRAPITAAAERLDAGMMAARLSQSFPEPFKVKLGGQHANMTWHGVHAGGGTMVDWALNLVFSKPVVNISESGAWWRGFATISEAVTSALPDWGGGDPAESGLLAVGEKVELDQLSIVAVKDGDVLAMEIRGFGDSVGQVSGLLEIGPDGGASGEFLLSGESDLVKSVTRMNPDFGSVLSLLASGSPGLKVAFAMEPGGEPVFSFPFLDDARKIRNDLLREAPDGAP